MTRATRPAMVVAVALAAAPGCGAGDDWSPAAQHDRADRRRADQLAAHLEALPGVHRASVVIDAPRPDPLAPPAPPPSPRASVVLALAPGADGVALEAAARRAVAAGVTGLAERDVAVARAAPPAAIGLVSVGPFEVAPGSRTPLVATLVAALAVIAALAGWLARRGLRDRAQARRGTRPQ